MSLYSHSFVQNKPVVVMAVFTRCGYFLDIFAWKSCKSCSKCKQTAQTTADLRMALRVWKIESARLWLRNHVTDNVFLSLSLSLSSSLPLLPSRDWPPSGASSLHWNGAFPWESLWITWWVFQKNKRTCVIVKKPKKIKVNLEYDMTEDSEA